MGVNNYVLSGTRHNRRNFPLTGRISELLYGSRHGGPGTHFDEAKKSCVWFQTQTGHGVVCE